MQFKHTFHFKSNISLVLLAASFLGACGDRSQQQTGAQTGKNPPAAATAQSAEKSSVLTGQINSSPLFESQQGWSAGYAKAIGHGPGVVVGPGADNPNVFAQEFPTKPGEPFKVIARAASVNKPKAMGRIQINWLDAQGKFISVSSKAFEVAPEEKSFDYDVVAPAGAAVGTLYVVADGKDSVVRYTEMRLLGKEDRVKAN